MDEDLRAAFGRHMVATLTGGATTMLVGLGYRTGLFEAAAQGPATSAGLADRGPAGALCPGMAGRRW